MGKKQRIGGYYLLDLGGVDLDEKASVVGSINIGTDVWKYLRNTKKRVVIANFTIAGIKQPDIISNTYCTDDDMVIFERVSNTYDLELYNSGYLVFKYAREIATEEDIKALAKGEALTNKYPDIGTLRTAGYDIVDSSATDSQLEMGEHVYNTTDFGKKYVVFQNILKKGYAKYGGCIYILVNVLIPSTQQTTLILGAWYDNSDNLQIGNVITIEMTQNLSKIVTAVFTL